MSLEPVITSLLDTDLYKMTMQAAVLDHFPDNTDVQYMFHNRTKSKQLTDEAIDWLKKQIHHLGTLRISTDEIDFLRKYVPQLPDKYLKFLQTVQLNPDKEVIVKHDKNTGSLDLFIQGQWLITIMYEIPLLALVSEAYFKFVDTDWNYDGQLDKIKEKANALMNAECKFTEFGTRRRRSKHTQDLILKGLTESCGDSPYLLGTSNVMFAKKYNLKPTGTVAHEWMMGVAALTHDYSGANKKSMDLWIETFGKDGAGFALTDTFGTDNFLQSFVRPYTDYYSGVRQDSGDPLEYTKRMGAHYQKLGYPAFSKSILYSDSLNVKKCIEYKHAAENEGLKPFFGVGTYFTNDFSCASDSQKISEPVNIVIKINKVNGAAAVKISDNMSKNTGDADTVRKVKEELGYIEKNWSGANEEHRWIDSSDSTPGP